nr:hypothetical protein [Actinomycetota bacterium]
GKRSCRPPRLNITQKAFGRDGRLPARRPSHSAQSNHRRYAFMDLPHDGDGGVAIGYVAWTWDDWSTCDGPTLITDYRGDPPGYGVGVRRHFRSRFA